MKVDQLMERAATVARTADESVKALLPEGVDWALAGGLEATPTAEAAKGLLAFRWSENGTLLLVPEGLAKILGGDAPAETFAAVYQAVYEAAAGEPAEKPGTFEAVEAGTEAIGPALRLTITLDGEEHTLVVAIPHLADAGSRIGLADLGAESLARSEGRKNLGLLGDVEVEVTVELGRRRLALQDLLKLTRGSVIELEKLVGEPLEVYVNNRLIADGEAVVVDEQFGIRITNLIAAPQAA